MWLSLFHAQRLIFHCQDKSSWKTAIHCLGYLFATKHLGLILGAGGSDKLVCFLDSDWASNPVTRQSIGGHILLFGGQILSWTSKTQKGIIALSTTESEFIQLALSIWQLLFIQPIFHDSYWVPEYWTSFSGLWRQSPSNPIHCNSTVT